MRRTKIAYVVRDLTGHGGIQVFAKNTGTGLDNNLVSVKLLTWSSPLSLIQEVLVRILPTFISKWLYDHWFNQDIDNILMHQTFDLVHFWHVKSAMAVIDNIKLPYMITCHGSEVLSSFVSAYQRTKFIRALKGASLITTPSEFTKNYLVNEYGINNKKVVVVHPGINVNSFKLREDAANAIPHIGTLSRLIPRKNVLNIIKALELLKNRGIDFNYSLAGTGFFYIRMRILAELKRSHFKWQYLGRITDKAKESQFYPSLDIFVLPPLEMPKDVEGFGVVFLEANASGVPVIASRTGGIADAVKENVSGLFADPASPEDIADKIYQALNSKKDYKKSSRKWAEKFSQEKSAQQLQLLYQEIAKAHVT